MEFENLKIKIKYLSDQVIDVEIPSNTNIVDLKVRCAKLIGVPASEQKIIFKGLNFNIALKNLSLR